jgi:hypothetical protein
MVNIHGITYFTRKMMKNKSVRPEKPESKDTTPISKANKINFVDIVYTPFVYSDYRIVVS